jgi:hypothetical protein
MSALRELDTVIAQLASGLRILLNIDKDGNYQLKGNPVMSHEAPAASMSDRYDVLVVEKYEDEGGVGKSNWTRVGVAFPHKDGLGLNVELRAIPVSGKLVIRRHENKSKSADGV